VNSVPKLEEEEEEEEEEEKEEEETTITHSLFLDFMPVHKFIFFTFTF
jgi:hypothetical protein